MFGMLFTGGRVFFLALSAAGRAKGQSVYHDAYLDPDQAPWRVLWAFTVADVALLSRGCVPPRSAMENPIFFCSC